MDLSVPCVVKSTELAVGAHDEDTYLPDLSKGRITMFLRHAEPLRQSDSSIHYARLEIVD